MQTPIEAAAETSPNTKTKGRAPKGKKGRQAKEGALPGPDLESQFEILLEGEELPVPEFPPPPAEAAEPPSLVEPGLAGKTVAICGPGVSIKDLFAEAAKAGGSHALADETWCVDAMAPCSTTTGRST